VADAWADAPVAPAAPAAPAALAVRPPLELILEPVPMPVPVPAGQLAPPAPSPLATLPTPQWCVLPAIGWQARGGRPASGPGAMTRPSAPPPPAPTAARAASVLTAAEIVEIEALAPAVRPDPAWTDEFDALFPGGWPDGWSEPDVEARAAPDPAAVDLAPVDLAPVDLAVAVQHEPAVDDEPEPAVADGPGAGALRTAARWASFAVLGAGLWVLLLTTVPRLFGWQPTVITGHSMEPSIERGDVVVVRPAPATVFVPGAVVTFVDINHPGHLITHRIVKVNPDGTLVTKGDHNHDNDPQSLAVANVKGRAVLRVPYVGRPVVWIIDRDWIPLGVTALVLVGVVHTALHPVGARRRPRPWPRFTAPERGT